MIETPAVHRPVMSQGAARISPAASHRRPLHQVAMHQSLQRSGSTGQPALESVRRVSAC